jgi:3-oxoacyl-[acyl-carrier-protein] synthase-1
MEKRIFLSEPSLVCCAGLNRDELYKSCLAGERSGFIMSGTGEKKYPVGMIKKELPSAEIEGFGTAAFASQTRIIKIINAAICQMREAIENIILKYGRDRIGVCLGSCDNGSEASLNAHKIFLNKNAFPDEYNLKYQSASFPAEFIAKKFDLRGPVFTVATACASGASAIMRGAELIRSGLCGAVIAGGADVVSPTVLSGFCALEAVSDEPANPFSKNRKGINLGEGAAFFILDSEEISAIELLGAGESADAYHMTAPGIDGEGPVKAMKAALAQAGLESERVGYINLHGTGTELNDKAEALALKKVFKIPVPSSSTKPITGHTLGAAGALEAAVCWTVINEKKGLPVHLWDGVCDEEAPFLPADSSYPSPSICMSNSFAFGGCNVSLILGTSSEASRGRK